VAGGATTGVEGVFPADSHNEDVTRLDPIS
jgi:hypothetical protein